MKSLSCLLTSHLSPLDIQTAARHCHIAKESDANSDVRVWRSHAKRGAGSRSGKGEVAEQRLAALLVWHAAVGNRRGSSWLLARLGLRLVLHEVDHLLVGLRLGREHRLCVGRHHSG